MNKSRNTGKITPWALSLLDAINSGKYCNVFTVDPDRAKRLFKQVTGKDLVLTEIPKHKNLYIPGVLDTHLDNTL